MADSEKYSVKKGDSLIKIAKYYEVKDWKALWRHTENKDLNKKYKGDETKISPQDILWIPAELSQKVAGYPVQIGKKTYTFKSERERDSFLKTVRILKVKGETVALTPEEWDKFQKDALSELRRTVVLAFRLRADGADTIWQHFNDLNKEDRIVSFFVSLGGPKLPNYLLIKTALSYLQKLEAAVKSADFAAITSAIENGEEPINTAYRVMKQYQEDVIGRAGTQLAVLQVTKTVSFMVLAAAATPAGAGLAEVAVASGSVKFLESSMNELGKSLAGGKDDPLAVLKNVGLDVITAATVGMLIKSSKGKELIKSVSDYAAKQVSAKLTKVVAQEYLEKYFAKAGEKAIAAAIEETGKAVKDGTTVKDFAVGVTKSTAIDLVLGPLSKAIDTKYAPSIVKMIPKDFWTGTKTEPTKIVKALLDKSASKLAESSLDSAFGAATGSESPEAVVDDAAKRLVKDAAFMEQLKAAAKAQ